MTLNRGIGSTPALAVALTLSVAAANAAAQPPTVTVLHSFNGLDGDSPAGLMLVGPQELWGVSTSGGLWGRGSIFRMTRDGRFTSVYSFLGLGDGASPLGLVLGPDGAVYGTTAQIVPLGASSLSVWGTLFRVAPSGALTTLFVFRESGVGYRPGPLTVTHDGAIVGYTNSGGSEGHGTLFELSTNGDLTVLHAFNADENPASVAGQMVEDVGGTLWATTAGSRTGSLLKITRSGAATVSAVGGSLYGGFYGLVQAREGGLYGTFIHDGIPSYQTYPVYLDPSLNGTVGPAFFNQYFRFWTEDANGLLFASIESQLVRATLQSHLPLGRAPGFVSSVVDGNDGWLYGTSAYGGLFEGGVVFRISKAGSAARVPNDFDADRNADPAVYRPSTGTWYVAASAVEVPARQFGLPGDIPVPGDYDGDGKTDDAVFRPSDATWHIRSSATSLVTDVAFGEPGDIPVPADYHGTGLLDLAVFRPSDGHWYNADSYLNNTFWGLPGDVPVPADFDGDGRTDNAVYRPSTNTWWLEVSGWIVRTWGIPGDVPVPADYDGDGKVDIAMYRPSTGQWFILTSRSNFTTSVVYQWGVAGDTPVPADYDGDGKADVAVYRPSNGYWFILKSSTNYTAWDTIQWGAPGDIPLAPMPHQNVP